MTRAILTFGLTTLLFTAISSTASAQTSYRPPGGSPLPRALDYFRRDVGALDNYNTFVAPRRQIDNNFRMLQAQEQADTRRTQQSLSQIRASMAAPTGSNATYMNYSHYYPTRQNTRRP